MLWTHKSALTFELYCYPRFPLGARALVCVCIYICVCVCVYVYVCEGGKF